MTARIVALLALAEEAPDAAELAPFLTDADPAVRRTALHVLSEAADDWAAGSVWVARALLDPDGRVRAAATELLAELREVLVAGPEVTALLERAVADADPVVRAAALGALWRHRRAGADVRRHLADPDPLVRAEAVLALVSLGAPDGPAAAAGDRDPSVRAAAARGLGTLADPAGAPVLVGLAADPEREVVIAALTALGRTGCPAAGARRAVACLRDPYWQVREAAVRALGGAGPDVATAALLAAATDDSIDVRTAAVRALGELAPGRPEAAALVADALRRATEDPDADVRAHARIGLDRVPAHTTER